ncbi:MAG: heat-inducible transcriptional repressor HrcA [Pseudomonadota bacterium]|jgi:heat-inducible transcriptional repressor|nr:heat-inducible transcriptional repressor HrcA [Alphaproteobacteria bacterium]
MSVTDLSLRSLEIFRELVDTYVETGEPVGSRTLSRRIKTPLSPATIRNVMADLEEAGLLYAPHTSAGRLPTAEGLKLFVHGLLEVGDISESDRLEIENHCTSKGKSVEDILEQATGMLSGLSKCAGLVMAPKSQSAIRHIEFVHLGHQRALAVLISQDGVVENRLIDLPEGITISMLTQASNYINSNFYGATLQEVLQRIHSQMDKNKHELDLLTQKVIEAGVGVWSGDKETGSLIIKGQSNLLQNVQEIADLEKIRGLFDVMDTQESLHKLLNASIQADGVQIFIGSENNLFSLSGCSMVVSPYENAQRQVVGAIGVVGPANMNYGKIIPLVDYTAKLVTRLLS